jgi:hypothetical protein
MVDERAGRGLSRPGRSVRYSHGLLQSTGRRGKTRTRQRNLCFHCNVRRGAQRRNRCYASSDSLNDVFTVILRVRSALQAEVSIGNIDDAVSIWGKINLGSLGPARSCHRRRRGQSVSVATNPVLKKTEAERDGLKRRLYEILSRTAIVGGNGVDDYLTRTEDRSSIDAEIHRGQKRLVILHQNIFAF